MAKEQKDMSMFIQEDLKIIEKQRTGQMGK